MGISGVNSFTNEARQALKNVETDAVAAVKDIARALTTEMMARTPVWSGKTVRNYVWRAWGAAGGMGEERSQIGSNPLDLKGTGHMALGSEPRRPENEDAALAEMEDVLSSYTKLGRSLYVTNFSSTWDLVDNGTAPTADRARNPGGVSILAVQSVQDQFGDILE